MMCHEDPEMTTERDGKTVSLFVDLKTLEKSVHAGLKCTGCHPGAAVEDFPHPELDPVNCGTCHEEPMRRFDIGIHGQAVKLHDPNAPDC